MKSNPDLTSQKSDTVTRKLADRRCCVWTSVSLLDSTVKLIDIINTPEYIITNIFVPNCLLGEVKNFVVEQVNNHDERIECGNDGDN